MPTIEYILWFMCIPGIIVAGYIMFYIYQMLFRPEQYFQRWANSYHRWGVEISIVDKQRFQKASRLCAVCILMVLGISIISLSFIEHIPWSVIILLVIVVAGYGMFYSYLILFRPEQWSQRWVNRNRRWGVEASIVDKQRFQKASRLCAVGPLIGIGIAIISIGNLHHSQAFGRALSIAGVGEDLETRGNIQGALEKYQEAVKMDTHSAYLLALLGKAYHETGQDDKALAAYEAALKISPRHFWVHYLIGELYQNQHRYNDAIKKFNELVSMKDNWYGSNKTFDYIQYQNLAYGQLGYCYAQLGLRQESLAAYEQYLIKNPSAADRQFVENYIQRLKAAN